MFPSRIRNVLISCDRNTVTKCVSRQKSALASSAEIFEDVKSFDDIPSPPGLPIFGHLHLLMKKENAENMVGFFGGLQAKYGNIVRIKVPGIGNGNMVVLFKPSDVKSLYSNEERIPKLPGFANFEYLRAVTLKDKYKTCGLISNKEDWYNVRTLVQQDMMRPKSAMYYTKEMDEIAREVVDIIERDSDSDQCYEINKICQQYALETVAYIFLGSRLGTLSGQGDGRRMIEISEEAGPISQDLMFVPSWSLKFLPKYKTFVRLSIENFDICEKHLTKAIETADSETIIAKLVARCGKDSPIPLIMGLDSIFAGIDTTGSTAAFLLYHLAVHPEKQEILYKEICKVIGPTGDLTEAALAKMKYMKAVQFESQRILPAIFGTSRYFEKDITVGGFRIPKGTVVVRNGAFASMDPDNFTDPDKFLPERWLRGHEARHNADSFANIPFGHGARACIGQRFAKLELFTLMAKIVQNYKMDYVGDGELGIKTRLVTVPDRQIKIRFSKRQ